MKTLAKKMLLYILVAFVLFHSAMPIYAQTSEQESLESQARAESEVQATTELNATESEPGVESEAAPQNDPTADSELMNQEPYQVVFSFNRPLDEAVGIPELMTVNPGESINLPSLDKQFTSRYSFLGWYDKADSTRQLLAPATSVVIEANTEFVALWEGNYGKVFVQFHTEAFTGDGWDSTHVGVADLSGFSAQAIGTDRTEYALSPIANQAGRMQYSGLAKAEYGLAIAVPQDYRVVAVKTVDRATQNIVDVDLDSERFAIPWYQQNMTMGPSYFVQVEKLEPTVARFISHDTTLDQTVALPDDIILQPGEALILPDLSPSVTDKYSFLGWYTSEESKYNHELLLPGTEITLEADTDFIAHWDGNYGKVFVQFHTEAFTGDGWDRTHVGVADLSGFSAQAIGTDRTEYALSPIANQAGRMQYSGLAKAEYGLAIAVPQDYRVVAVKTVDRATQNIVDVDLNSERFAIPWYQQNMTMGPSYFVQVEKIEPTVARFISHDTTLDQTVALPDDIVVQPGEALILPDLSPSVTDKYSFLGWYTSEESKYNHNLLLPGTEITLDNDTDFIAHWDGNYGKVFIQFHTEAFTGDGWDRTHVGVADLSGFSAQAIGIDRTEYALSPIANQAGRMQYFGLAKAEYGINISIPENYRLVAVKTVDRATQNIVDVDLDSERFAIPWYQQNMTMGPSYFVQVEPKEFVNLSYDPGEGSFAEVPAPIKVERNTTVQVLSPEDLGLDHPGYTFSGWLVAESDPIQLLESGAEFEMLSDTLLIAQWEVASAAPETGEPETAEPSKPETDEPSKSATDKLTKDQSKSKANLPNTGLGDNKATLIVALVLLLSALIWLKKEQNI